ncbi:heavy metal translocating P-type ATPase [Roseiarcaceae bacterium H3SJ34-1]|jgi:Zn2+/Cd2+-exporting ATPase|uniref:heavy metal translocating P-type ATPase n=1 Tax=Hyphomicrobiales TaxID=356 RepID=UPI0007108580|nr:MULTISPECIES: heavy metal translocating P-type ATPase [unclassified Bradyrhizobium]KQT22691.1 ATPase [Bradyrhizobium sp. Leaf396]MDF2117400.1 heavy metal translocating P-type ATPase [Roseiarcaceae bacterium H3SJ34-1]
MAAASPLKLQIEGMDCAACALKIEAAMERLPGVSDINVSYAAGTLALNVDQDRTSQRTIEEKIRTLGYQPAGSAPGTQTALPTKRARDPWWRGMKARLVFMTGALFATAFVASFFLPAWDTWLYAGAALVSVVPFARRAVAGALEGSPFSIETLMTVAALGAVAIGETEEAAVVIFLFAVGELLETVAAGRARAGIEALIDLVPRTAFRLDPLGQTESVPVEALAIDDRVVVRPGDRVPSDGVVEDGSSEVNEAPVTGESVPILKEPGAKVFAGSINANGELRVRITRVAADNTIARIIHMVEEAQESKAPTARMIDRFSKYYTPGAMIVAALIIVVPPLAFGADWMTWIYRGLATLLIACPCALVISTPAAIASGLAAGARQGLLIKGGAALETLGKVVTVAFDKTGTLTRGHPKVTDVIALSGSEDDVLARAAAVERNVSHPLGIAIVEAAQERALELPQVFGGGIAVPGKAVTARLKSGFASVGSPRHAAEGTEIPADVRDRILALEAKGKTVVVLMTGKAIEGLIALRDEPRDDAAEGIRRLKERGVRVLMLSGDNQRTASAIASSLGLEAKGELLPDAKLAEIGRLKESGPVAMVGDGINDAPALAAASVGVSMGGGTDVALETADAALLRDRVEGVAGLVALSQATLGNIRQNITIALGLKAVFLVTTLFGVTTLWMAILADTGATVLVTANALRLLAYGSSKQ